MNPTKKVTVISTQGLRRIDFDTKAKTWGELKAEILQHNPKIDNITAMRATVGHTNNRLDQDNALIPLTDFALFLTIEKSNSGAGLTYKEAREKIKEIKENLSKDEFKNFFPNYPQQVTESLNEMIDNYTKQVSVIEKKTTEEKVVEETSFTKNGVLIPITNKFGIVVDISAIPTGTYVPLVSEEEIATFLAKLK